MFRTIEIKGVQVTLETGVPLTDHRAGFGRPKTGFRLMLEAMNTGESAYLPAKLSQSEQQCLSATGRTLGRKYAYRTEGEGTRVFCLAKPISAKANGSNVRAVPKDVAKPLETVSRMWA